MMFQPWYQLLLASLTMIVNPMIVPFCSENILLSNSADILKKNRNRDHHTCKQSCIIWFLRIFLRYFLIFCRFRSNVACCGSSHQKHQNFIHVAYHYSISNTLHRKQMGLSSHELGLPDSRAVGLFLDLGNRLIGMI